MDEEPDMCIIELGGTMGNIESAPFVEAMQQFQFCIGYANFALIHILLVPDMHGEQKTKPMQTTVHSLREISCITFFICLFIYALIQLFHCRFGNSCPTCVKVCEKY